MANWGALATNYKKEKEEKDRLEKEKAEKERLEKERLEKEKAENERIEKEKQEKEKQEREKQSQQAAQQQAPPQLHTTQPHPAQPHSAQPPYHAQAPRNPPIHPQAMPYVPGVQSHLGFHHQPQPTHPPASHSTAHTGPTKAPHDQSVNFCFVSLLNCKFLIF